MDAVTLLRERRSIRAFKDEVIDREIMKKIIDNAIYYPSWANTQTARYTLIDDKEIVKKLAEEGMFGPNIKTVGKAPAALVISYVNGFTGKAPGGNEFVTKKGASWDMFDAGIASQNFCLAAYEKGVGTVIMGLFDEDKVSEIIDLPENETVAAVIPYGYETKHPKAAPRKAIDEVVRYI
ncbi:nitroreductase [Oceanispirochaeta crateris]|uniref:Nitroreductase n=1 Tax=Oceanispirochaeta crateris TaxID=2518645 RepID=A0A5C1QMQ4_9SPIO|nr:nitroreductase family protein [Oceanispirochaeta crateris]QEN08240.1 nitroreductase [Oceanispirochaeta crateris]